MCYSTCIEYGKEMLGYKLYKNDNSQGNENEHSLNMDISVNIAYTPFKFETCIPEIQMEGIMSRNVD